MTAFQTLAGRVRILAGDASTVAGAGIQLTASHVLTCWHVVDGGAGSARVPLAVDTPARPGQTVAATVEWFTGIGPRGEGDLAVLRTATALDSPPATLADRDADELEVRVAGYPAYTPTQVIVRARVIGPPDADTGWRQLDQISTATAVIDRGFSGAGAFDPAGRVVGMVVARAGAGGRTVAWMLPVRQWARLVPTELAPRWPARPAPGPLSFTQRVALAELLAEVPVLQAPDRRQLVIQSLPPELRRAVQSFGPLGLDMFGLVRTVLEFRDGFADLFQVLRALEGRNSRSLEALGDLAVNLGLRTGTEDDR